MFGHSFLPTVLLLASTLFSGSANAAWDLTKKNNVVLYWGQNAHGQANPGTTTPQKRLVEYCKDPNVDLISIGFLYQWDTTDGHPLVNFSNMCWQTFPGTSVLWCPEISQDIITCQKTYGKKILLSIGGGTNTYAGFATNTAAVAFAERLWNMFGKGWTYYRPFGEAIVDGFDFDIETLPAQNYNWVAWRLRQLFTLDTSKKYFLTAAPQCPNPSAHLSNALASIAFDAIFLQFYNNPCGAHTYVINSTPNLPMNTNNSWNYRMWVDWIRTTSMNKNLKIIITLPASAKVATVGYVNAFTAARIAIDMNLKYPTSIAGMGFWDASEMAANTGYLASVKNYLNLYVK